MTEHERCTECTERPENPEISRDDGVWCDETCYALWLAKQRWDAPIPRPASLKAAIARLEGLVYGNTRFPAKRDHE